MLRATIIGLSIGAAALGGGLVWTAGNRITDSALPRALYERGANFSQFVAADTSRQALWRANYARAGLVGEKALARVSRAPGRWRLLVVGESWCGDGANSVPYLAWLADNSPNLELRIVRKHDGGALLATHKVNGREAIPLVLLLDENFVERGAWVEQPKALREMVARRTGESGDETHDMVVSWYAGNGGRAVLEELSAIVDAAAAPSPCQASQ
jgi:hypothetical protein